MIRLILMVIILSAGTWGASAFAQSATPQAKKQMLAHCQRVIDAALAKITPHLHEYKNLQNKKDLVLLVPAADVNAFANYEDQQVLIPVMLCIQSWYLVDAMVQMYETPSLQPSVVRYTKYLHSRQREAVRSGPVDNVIIKPFNDFSGTARKKLSAADQQKYAGKGEAMLVEGMAFLLGHEIGHLALIHRRYDEISSVEALRQEDGADAFAARLLADSKVSILPSMLSFMWFMESEAVLTGIQEGRRTHPRAECRFERIVASSSELNELMKDPKRRLEFERGSGYTVQQYEDLMLELREDCLRSP